MFQRIVVPLDGSELAELALPFAEEMSCLTGAPIHLVRVIDPAPDGLRVYGSFGLLVEAAPLAMTEQTEREEAESYLARVAKDLVERAFNPGPKCGSVHRRMRS